MTQLDEATLALLTNDEVLAVNQASDGNRQLFEKGDLIAWVADVPESTDKYLAVFNTGDAPAPVPVELASIGLTSDVAVIDLWIRSTQDDVRGTFAPIIPSHGARALPSSRPLSLLERPRVSPRPLAAKDRTPPKPIRAFPSASSFPYANRFIHAHSPHHHPRRPRRQYPARALRLRRLDPLGR